MMEKSFGFNSVNGDRRYKAEDFVSYFASFIGNGVFPNPSMGLQVVENNNMSVVIKEGKGWINGYYYTNTEYFILNVDVADSLLNRLDRIVLRLDFNKRSINLYIKKGQFASSPVAPQLQRNADAYELALADIRVNAGAISITQADIVDLRLSKELCGIVHGTVEQVDTTAIFNQFQDWYTRTKNNYNKDITKWTEDKKQAFDAWYNENTTAFLKQFNDWYGENTEKWSNDFNNWFATIKGVLDGDVAGNLLNQINEIKKNKTEIIISEENIPIFKRKKDAFYFFITDKGQTAVNKNIRVSPLMGLKIEK